MGIYDISMICTTDLEVVQFSVDPSDPSGTYLSVGRYSLTHRHGSSIIAAIPPFHSTPLRWRSSLLTNECTVGGVVRTST